MCFPYIIFNPQIDLMTLCLYVLTFFYDPSYFLQFQYIYIYILISDNMCVIYGYYGLSLWKSKESEKVFHNY